MAHLRKLLYLGNTQLLLVALFTGLALQTPLIDPDYFWHLKTGEWIVQHGQLPPGDVFSYTREGQHWVAHEWLFEVLLYLTYQYAGALGIKLLTAALCAGSVGLVLWAASCRIPNVRFESAIMAIGAMISFYTGLAPRPQLLTYLGVAAVLWILVEFKYRQKLWPLILLPLIAIPWVNAHGGYLIGVTLALLFAACEWCQYLLAPVAAQRQRLIRLTAAASLMLVATLANPWFIEHWRYPFDVVGMRFNVNIQEWTSPDFHKLDAQVYLATAFVFVLAAAWAKPRLDLTEWVLPASFMFLGFTSLRHIPLAALVLLVFGTLALARGNLPFEIVGWLAALTRKPRAFADRLWRRPQERAKPRIESERVSEQSLGAALRNWALLAALAVAVAAVQPALQAKDELRLTESLPVDAGDFVAKAGLQGRMFNSYNHGGYLIYRFAPQLKVAIDGRADMYGDDFLFEYQRAYSGMDGWKATFDKLKIDFVLLPCDAPLRQLLLIERSFREVYRDKHNVVMVRAGAAQWAELPSMPAGPAALDQHLLRARMAQEPSRAGG